MVLEFGPPVLDPSTRIADFMPPPLFNTNFVKRGFKTDRPREKRKLLVGNRQS